MAYLGLLAPTLGWPSLLSTYLISVGILDPFWVSLMTDDNIKSRL